MFLPDNIDLGQSDKYILSIRISPSLFSYSIHAPRIRGEFCYHDTKFSKDSDILSDIQQIIFDYNFLTLRFLQTNVIFVSKDYELIPDYLLEKNKKNKLYNFTHSEKFERVLSSTISIQKSTVLFGIDEGVYKFLVRSLFNPQFYHHTIPILRYIDIRKQAKNNRHKMFLNFHDEFVDVFCYDGKFKLKYNITFQNESELNLLYYIMNIWVKSKFDQKQDYLYILDNHHSKGRLVIEKFREYIKNIEMVGTSTEIDLMNSDNKQVPLDLLIQLT